MLSVGHFAFGFAKFGTGGIVALLLNPRLMSVIPSG